jgi:plastocyanin
MNTHRGRRRLLALAIGWLLFAPVPGVRAATEAVDEVGTSFQPAQVEVVVGDTVVWTNRSNTAHSVAFQSGPDLHPTCAPGLLGPVGNCQDPGDTAQYTFTAARSYAYACKLHTSMRGVVIVSPAGTSSTTTTASPTTPTTRSTTTTIRATSSTTSTTRALATSSTVVKSSTTTSDTTSVLLPGDAPPFSGDDVNSATGQPGGSSDDGGDATTVTLIVGLLLAVSAGGGYLLWRLRPGRV